MGIVQTNNSFHREILYLKLVFKWSAWKEISKYQEGKILEFNLVEIKSDGFERFL